MTGVLLIGDINIDILISIPKYPRLGGDATAQKITTRPGGSVANTAMVLSKLGLGVQMIGRTGEDLWADLALTALASQGVNTEHITKDPELSTGLIFIPVTHDGERTMFSYRGANVHIHPHDIEARLFEGLELLHISGFNFLASPQREATRTAIAFANERGIPISLDVGVTPKRETQEEILDILPKLSLCVLGREEAQALVGTTSPEEAAGILLAAGVKRIGFKLGPSGCLVAEKSGEYRLPAFKIDTVDTTGAGDAFCAGFIYAWVTGLKLDEAGLLANTLGALATSVWGAGPALPGRLAAIDLLHGQLPARQRTGYEQAVLKVLQTLEGLES